MNSKAITCQKAHCPAEYKASIALSQKMNKETIRLVQDHKKGLITKDELKTKLAEHRKKISVLFTYPEYQGLLSCSLKNCYHEYTESLKFLDIVALLACQKDKTSEQCHIGNRMRSKLRKASPMTLDKLNDLLRDLMKIMPSN